MTISVTPDGLIYAGGTLGKAGRLVGTVAKVGEPGVWWGWQCLTPPDYPGRRHITIDTDRQRSVQRFVDSLALK